MRFSTVRDIVVPQTPLPAGANGQRADQAPLYFSMLANLTVEVPFPRPSLCAPTRRAGWTPARSLTGSPASGARGPEPAWGSALCSPSAPSSAIPASALRTSDLIVIPGGMASQLQPLGVCLDKSVKGRVRVPYNEWLTSGQLKRAPLQTLAGWACEAKCGIRRRPSWARWVVAFFVPIVQALPLIGRSARTRGGPSVQCL